MNTGAPELRVLLTVEQADRLDGLSNGRDMTMEALASQLLGEVIERTELTPAEVGRILDKIPGFRERLQLSLEQGLRGDTITVEEWAASWSTDTTDGVGP